MKNTQKSWEPGHIPSKYSSRLWKFKADEVDEWVKAGGAADDSKKD